MTVQDQATHPEVADLGEFTAAWQAWHAGQEARLADPHGFLAITSLHWLTETPQRFDDAPGAWYTGPDGVTVELADGEELVIGGAAVRGGYSFGVIPERGGVNAGWGDAVIEVAKRGGHDIVRPRHPDTPLRVQFARHTGLPAAFAVGCHRSLRAVRRAAADHGGRGRGRAAARLRRSRADRVRAERAAAEPHGLPRSRSGQLDRAVHRRHLRGHDVRGQPGPAAGAPGPDGRVVLDFNRATNLPCAYTDLATCPLPPPENRLPVAIEAGEKIPDERR